MKNHHLAILILLVAVVGCKLPGFSSGGGLGGTSKGTATGGSDPKADVIEASKKFIALPSFRANMEGAGQTEIKSQVEYLAPDRFHVTYLGGTGAGMEIIFIGKDGYMKSGDKWSKMPSTGQSIPNLRDSFTEEGLKTLSDVEYEGDDSVNGKSASVYSYKNVTPVGAHPFTSKIWISNDTGVPMKIHVEYPNNPALKYMDVSYDMEAKVTIEPPIKQMNRDLALPLILLASVAIGCSWISDSGMPDSLSDSEVNSPANVATNSAPATTRENPAADIEAMADKFLAEKSFRAKIRGTGDKDVKTDLEFVAPDRFRIKTGPGLETIVIGKDVYLSMGDSFQKLPGAMDGSIPDLRATFNKEGRKWFSDVRFVGEESVSGKPSLVYEYKNIGEGNLGENDSTIWVAKDDGLPLKIESRYKTGNLKTMVIEYECDPNIKIEVPVTKK